ncbi:(d)CMP kinase, partial [Francisella tularensis]|uniref:(d)CMP kinase n=1 Tax=Francisella tularensis TaxID=263 RepID=UPI002381A8E3
MNNSNIIPIDGPSGVGKGNLAKALAKYYDFKLLDSGAIYILAAIHCFKYNAILEYEDDVCKTLRNLDISFKI